MPPREVCTPRRLAALALLVAARAVAGELTINTDRPAVTDSSPVVPPGALQVEGGLEVSDNAGRHDQTSEATLLFDRQLSAASDAFLEYAGDFPQHGGSQQLLHAGCAWRMSARRQLDVHAGAGLSAAAPRWFVGLGYSWLQLR
jgi:hypothetical protein